MKLRHSHHITNFESYVYSGVVTLRMIAIWLSYEVLQSANEMFFLFLNLKEQQNQEDCHLPFLNISSSSRTMKV